LDRNLKEVRFDIYCKKCKYKDLKEKFDPCNDCLDEPYNIESAVPVKFEEGKNSSGNTKQGKLLIKTK